MSTNIVYIAIAPARSEYIRADKAVGDLAIIDDPLDLAQLFQTRDAAARPAWWNSVRGARRGADKFQPDHPWEVYGVEKPALRRARRGTASTTSTPRSRPAPAVAPAPAPAGMDLAAAMQAAAARTAAREAAPDLNWHLAIALAGDPPASAAAAVALECGRELTFDFVGISADEAEAIVRDLVEDEGLEYGAIEADEMEPGRVLVAVAVR